MITRHRFVIALGVAGVFGMSSGAIAGNVPLTQSSSGLYIWIDESYQSVHLPSFDLGFQRVAPPGGISAGPLERHDPHATGWGMTGAVGYRFPHGTFPAAFGSNFRTEIGWSYVKADDSQTGSSNFQGGGFNGFFLQLLNGLEQVTQPCSPNTVCRTASSLATDYQAWTVNAKAVSDFKSGPLTISPSLSIFGGQSRNNQSLAQTMISPGASPTLPIGTYSMSSALRYTDWGAKAGLDVTIDVTHWLAVGVGGKLGLAHRSVSLSASDSCADGVLPICTAFVPTAPVSSIAVSDNANPLLANAEASFVVKPWSHVAFRGFAGLNYDSDVPGISAPALPAGTALNSGTQGSAAGIKFESQTSYYAGGGVVWSF